MKKVAVFWFRRDLRLHDNHGLSEALKGEYPVLPIFIFDPKILDKLEDKDDARVQFIHELLQKIQAQLQPLGKGLKVLHNNPEEAFEVLASEFDIQAIYTNRDYEPYALERDQAIRQWLEAKGGTFHTFKDHVLFEQNEVTKADGNPYVVFTPYSRKWKAQVDATTFQKYDSKQHLNQLLDVETSILSIEDIGFTKSAIVVPDYSLANDLIQRYQDQRNLPAVEGTSRLSPHLRFGSISIREVARETSKHSESFLKELIWRDFYAQILWHFPHVAGNSFRAKYEGIEWRNNEEEFEKWCTGSTGFPIVDAGMRQLNATGWMHNRVRMIVASFLCKDLLIDWRWGEAYFARKLLDFDLASNNGGWQWASGSGTDAAPYFRVFNPESQQKKFDPKGEYIRKWIPEIESLRQYPPPMVDHKAARLRCLEVYKSALN
ncbi:MAG: DNA photolyase family protein [Saprospiraceae bacterium]|nr:DNA photolyase family protein [Saprospiraceae bacterium]